MFIHPNIHNKYSTKNIHSQIFIHRYTATLSVRQHASVYSPKITIQKYSSTYSSKKIHPRCNGRVMSVRQLIHPHPFVHIYLLCVGFTLGLTFVHIYIIHIHLSISTSCGSAWLLHLVPLVTMFGFRRVPCIDNIIITIDCIMILIIMLYC